jgi:hypothetical protein
MTTAATGPPPPVGTPSGRSRRSLIRRLPVFGVIVTAAALAVAGCGGGSPSPAAISGFPHGYDPGARGARVVKQTEPWLGRQLTPWTRKSEDFGKWNPTLGDRGQPASADFCGTDGNLIDAIYSGGGTDIGVVSPMDTGVACPTGPVKSSGLGRQMTSWTQQGGLDTPVTAEFCNPENAHVTMAAFTGGGGETNSGARQDSGVISVTPTSQACDPTTPPAQLSPDPGLGNQLTLWRQQGGLDNPGTARYCDPNGQVLLAAVSGGNGNGSSPMADLQSNTDNPNVNDANPTLSMVETPISCDPPKSAPSRPDTGLGAFPPAPIDYSHAFDKPQVEAVCVKGNTYRLVSTGASDFMSPAIELLSTGQSCLPGLPPNTEPWLGTQLTTWHRWSNLEGKPETARFCDTSSGRLVDGIYSGGGDDAGVLSVIETRASCSSQTRNPVDYGLGKQMTGWTRQDGLNNPTTAEFCNAEDNHATLAIYSGGGSNSYSTGKTSITYEDGGAISVTRTSATCDPGATPSSLPSDPGLGQQLTLWTKQDGTGNPETAQFCDRNGHVLIASLSGGHEDIHGVTAVLEAAQTCDPSALPAATLPADSGLGTASGKDTRYSGSFDKPIVGSTCRNGRPIGTIYSGGGAHNNGTVELTPGRGVC